MANNNISNIEPYLFFEGRCEEAIEFYKRTLGAQADMLMRFKDSPEPPPPGCVPAGSENKVMHASLRIGDKSVMMADGRCSGKPNFDGFALTLTVPTEAEADRKFAALSEGGKVMMPLAKTFFAQCFGTLNDRFGVHWMVIMHPESAK
jgi:PhnB protein